MTQMTCSKFGNVLKSSFYGTFTQINYMVLKILKKKIFKQTFCEMFVFGMFILSMFSG